MNTHYYPGILDAACLALYGATLMHWDGHRPLGMARLT